MYATIQLRTLEGFKSPDRWMRRRGSAPGRRPSSAAPGTVGRRGPFPGSSPARHVQPSRSTDATRFRSSTRVAQRGCAQ